MCDIGDLSRQQGPLPQTGKVTDSLLKHWFGMFLCQKASSLIEISELNRPDRKSKGQKSLNFKIATNLGIENS
jgi:hypothetical protein